MKAYTSLVRNSIGNALVCTISSPFFVPERVPVPFFLPVKFFPFIIKDQRKVAMAIYQSNISPTLSDHLHKKNSYSSSYSK